MDIHLDDLRQTTIDSQLKLLKEFPWEKDGCCLAYHQLVEYLPVTEILQWNDRLPHLCLMAMKDRGLASEVLPSIRMEFVHSLCL